METRQQTEERPPAPTAAPKPAAETPRRLLHIEELEPRLAPQSTTTILD